MTELCTALVALAVSAAPISTTTGQAPQVIPVAHGEALETTGWRYSASIDASGFGYLTLQAQSTTHPPFGPEPHLVVEVQASYGTSNIWATVMTSGKCGGNAVPWVIDTGDLLAQGLASGLTYTFHPLSADLVRVRYRAPFDPCLADIDLYLE